MKDCVIKIFTYVMVFSFVSCSPNKKETEENYADRLFEGSVQLYKIYTDSISNVNDSVYLHRLEDSFDLKLTQLYYSLPPNTDFDLTEEQNDSLIKLAQKLYDIKNTKEKYFSKNPADSLPDLLSEPSVCNDN